MKDVPGCTLKASIILTHLNQLETYMYKASIGREKKSQDNHLYAKNCSCYRKFKEIISGVTDTSIIVNSNITCQ